MPRRHLESVLRVAKSLDIVLVKLGKCLPALLQDWNVTSVGGIHSALC